MTGHNAYLDLTLFLQHFNVINKIITKNNSITIITGTVVIIMVPVEDCSSAPFVCDKKMEKRTSQRN